MDAKELLERRPRSDGLGLLVRSMPAMLFESSTAENLPRPKGAAELRFREVEDSDWKLAMVLSKAAVAKEKMPPVFCGLVGEDGGNDAEPELPEGVN